jgi:YbbR domain-containing protein
MQWLKRFLTHNWLAKLFSLVLASLLWLTISTQANSEIGINIPLEYRNIPANLEVTGDTTNNVEVRLRGPVVLIREIAPRDISAIVDLAAVPTGEKIVQLTAKNVKLPFGIDVVRVSPAQVRLNLEQTMSKIVPVAVRLSGAPAAGLAVGEVSVSPDRIEIEGPESRVRAITEVPTALVSVSGRRTSFSVLTDLDSPDAMVRLQQMSVVEVHVTVREDTSPEPERGNKR